MFDTHCHLQFKSFTTPPTASLGVNEVIKRAQAAGVNYIVVPGTDIITSQGAIQVAQKFENVYPDSIGVYAAVGIHPHHVFELTRSMLISNTTKLASSLEEIEKLLQNKKVVAIGEVGVDRHYYRMTKYSNYQVTNEFINTQKEILKAQIKLAIKYDKSLILHNREAAGDLLSAVSEVWDQKLEGRTVLHCCEPREELLEFAKQHEIYWGVDGDITFYKEKQEFIKRVPLEMLVLETDSPFLTPEPIRSSTKPRPLNEPANLPIIAEYIANLKKISADKLVEVTTQNAKALFGI